MSGAAGNVAPLVAPPPQQQHAPSEPEVDALRRRLRDAVAALARQERALIEAEGELTSLRDAVDALERSLRRTQSERTALQAELRAARAAEAELLDRVAALTAACGAMVDEGAGARAEYATQVAAIRADAAAQIEALRVIVDRVTFSSRGGGAGLVGAGGLAGAAAALPRPLPWATVSATADHPAHILCRVVALDAQREAALLRQLLPGAGAPGALAEDARTQEAHGLRALLIAAGEPPGAVLGEDDSVPGADWEGAPPTTSHYRADGPGIGGGARGGGGTLDALYEFDASSLDVFDFGGGGGGHHGTAASNDSSLWRRVCRRLHHVLSDRRRCLHIVRDGPTEFLLRSRHEMADALVHAERAAEVVWRAVTSVRAALGGPSGVLPAGTEEPVHAAEDAARATLHLIARTISRCFSEVDRAMLQRGAAVTDADLAEWAAAGGEDGGAMAAVRATNSSKYAMSSSAAGGGVSYHHRRQSSPLDGGGGANRSTFASGRGEAHMSGRAVLSATGPSSARRGTPMASSRRY